MTEKGNEGVRFAHPPDHEWVVTFFSIKGGKETVTRSFHTAEFREEGSKLRGVMHLGGKSLKAIDELWIEVKGDDTIVIDSVAYARKK